MFQWYFIFQILCTNRKEVPVAWLFDASNNKLLCQKHEVNNVLTFERLGRLFMQNNIEQSWFHDSFCKPMMFPIHVKIHEKVVYEIEV